MRFMFAAHGSRIPDNESRPVYLCALRRSGLPLRFHDAGVPSALATVCAERHAGDTEADIDYALLLAKRGWSRNWTDRATGGPLSEIALLGDFGTSEPAPPPPPLGVPDIPYFNCFEGATRPRLATPYVNRVAVRKSTEWPDFDTRIFATVAAERDPADSDADIQWALDCAKGGGWGRYWRECEAGAVHHHHYERSPMRDSGLHVLSE